jgi:hypothetical protein
MAVDGLSRPSLDWASLVAPSSSCDEGLPASNSRDALGPVEFAHQGMAATAGIDCQGSAALAAGAC